MIEKWDADEAAKDAKTYETKEKGLKAVGYIMKKYWEVDKIRKLIHQNKLWMMF